MAAVGRGPLNAQHPFLCGRLGPKRGLTRCMNGDDGMFMWPRPAWEDKWLEARTALAIGLWATLCATAVLADSARARAAPSAPAQALPEGHGVRAVPGIVPPVLEVGPATGQASGSAKVSARHCLTVVEISDAELACRQQTCVQLFPSRRTRPLANGQRAIWAQRCAAQPPADGPAPQLLWGSTGVLVLQPERAGPGLWSQQRSAAGASARLETEASYGSLSRPKASFVWHEAAN